MRLHTSSLTPLTQLENVILKHDNKTSTSALGRFERGLTIWVILSILAGIALGQLLPDLFQILANIQYANVNFIVGVLIWVMVYPMMIKVNFSTLSQVTQRPKGIILTTAVNWLVKPFTMAILAIIFFDFFFKDLINPTDAKQYVAGLILLGAAPCTAMVFVWCQLAKGDATFTLIQVSVNDVIMIFAFAPIVTFLLGVTDIEVPWETLLISVLIYVIVPLTAGVITRKYLENINYEGITLLSERLKPISIFGLLAIVTLLFGFQGAVIIEKPVVILLIAIPLIIQSYGIFIIAYAGAWIWRIPFKVSVPCALISTSNFFELAVAVAISLFGLNSGAALATVVGVLVEVPIMLSLLRLANGTKSCFLVRTSNFNSKI